MNIDNVIHVIEEGWKQALDSEFNKEYFIDLKSNLLIERNTYTVFPYEKDLFSALNLTPFNDVKVIIIGQDPYHGTGQANGLCFSVAENISHPPSLKNIFKESFISIISIKIKIIITSILIKFFINENFF